MHFIGIPLVFALSLIFTAVGVSAEGTSALASHQSLRQHCGPGHVLNTTTIHVNGHDVKVTTSSCPGVSKDAETKSVLRPRVEKRQSQICDTDCAVSCDVPTKDAPFISDCNLLTNALEGLFPQALFAPAQTVTSFEMFTCGVLFFNLDFVDMNYCYLDIGFHLAIIASHCFPTFDGPMVSSQGFCIPPQIPGNSWAIEGFNAA